MKDTPATWPVNVREPYTIYARFVGNGTTVPNPVANTTRPEGPPGGTDQGGGPITIVRNGTGNVTITIPKPFGIVQFYSAQVLSAAADVNARVTPMTAGSGALTVVMTFAANGTARDLTSSDELVVEVTGSLASRP